MNNQILVTVRLMGFLRKWSEAIDPQVKVPAGISVYELLYQLTLDNKKELHSALWDRSDQLHGGLELIFNEQVISPSQIRNTIISEDSEIILIPVIAGGALR